MSKQFHKKYMHPTRRKLVDMIHNGSYDAPISVSMSDIKPVSKYDRKVGERWTDADGQEWEQRNGYKIKVNKLTEMMSKVRDDIRKSNLCKSAECDKGERYGPTDKRLIKKIGYCSNCIARLEHQIRLDGLYKEYEQFRIMTNMLKEGHRLVETLKQALDESKQEYEFVNADGKTVKWTVDRPIEDVRADIISDMEYVKKEMLFVTQRRDEIYETLRDKNYEIVEYSQWYLDLLDGVEIEDVSS
jgi:hypothetical protein